MISTALDAIPTPPCSQLLGWRVLDARPEDSWIRIGFEGQPDSATRPGSFREASYRRCSTIRWGQPCS